MTLRASLDPPEVPVSHQALTGAVLRLHNDGEEPVEVRVEVTGEPSAWSWVTPADVTVAGGGTAEVRAVFKVPRAPLPAAGPLPVGFLVTPARSPQPPLGVSATLVVAPFTDVFATLDPPVASGTREGHATLALTNRGNHAVRVSVAGAAAPDTSGDGDGDGAGGGDGEEQLRVEVEPEVVTIEAGSHAEASVLARAPARLRRGAERQRPFQVVATVDHEPVATVGGALRQHGARSARLPRAALGLVGLVSAGAVAWTTVLAPEEPTAGPGDEALVAVDDRCPAEGHLGSAVHGQAQALTASGYAFLHADASGCRPVRFPACEPVHYVLNDALAPPGAVEDVHAAVDRLAEATGLRFVYDGPTDERLDAERPAYQPERYGERWAPILIGWSALGTGAGPDAAGDDIVVAGRGDPIRVGDSLVSGILELNADVILDRETQERLPGGFGEGITRGRVLLHELGHVMGLGHVSSRAQLMYPELAEHTSSTAKFGVGDRVGLRLVGREAGCLEPPPLPG